MRFIRHPEEHLEEAAIFRAVVCIIQSLGIATALLRRQPIIRGILLLQTHEQLYQLF
jgi:hypothetical protein